MLALPPQLTLFGTPSSSESADCQAVVPETETGETSLPRISPAWAEVAGTESNLEEGVRRLARWET